MEKSVISSIIALAVAVVLLTTVLIPMIDEASHTTVEIEANENPSWIRMSYYTGKLSDIVEVSYDSSYIIGTQRGLDDVIVYADSSSVIYSDNGTFWLYNSTTDVMLNSPFTIICSGYVTTVDDGTEYVLPQHSWMYFPDPNGHCSTYYDVDFRTDTPIAAVSEQFAGMKCYNNIGGISMTVVKDGETVDDVYWGKGTDNRQPLIEPQISPLNPSTINPQILKQTKTLRSANYGSPDNPLPSIDINADWVYGTSPTIYVQNGGYVNINGWWSADEGYTWTNGTGLGLTSYYQGNAAGHHNYYGLHGTLNQTGSFVSQWTWWGTDSGDWFDEQYNVTIVSVAINYTHTIYYNANGGSGSMGGTTVTDTNAGNSNVTFAQNGFTAPAHYHFVGWRINNTGTLYQPGNTYPVGANGSVTAYAQWEEDTRYNHTIAYNGNGATGGSTANTNVNDYNSGNTNVTLAANGYTWDHHTFTGWKINNAGTLYQPGQTVAVGGNATVTMYAQWLEDTRYTHTINYDMGTGTGGATSSTVVEDYNSGNTAVTFAANGFTKEHYHFIGWDVLGTTYQPGATINIVGNGLVTATALWAEDTRYDHTIVYDAGTGTGTMSNTVVNDYNSGNSNVTFAQNGFTKTNYHFIGWRVAGADYQPGDTIAIAGDSSVTAYAQWEEDTRYTHTVIYNAGTGSGSMSDTVVTDYNSGNTAVTLAVCTFTKTNYHFTGWLVGADTYQAGQTVNVIGDGSVTATAQWEEDTRYTHTITYDAGTGTGTMSATVVTDYNSGNSNVTFASNGFTKEHYHFTGWLVGVDTYQPGNTIAVIGNGSVTAVAQWEEDTRYTHTILYSGNGNTGGMTASTVVTDYNNAASPVTFAECGYTKTNYHFIGWKLNNQGTLYQPGQTVLVNAGASVVAYAQWSEDPRYTHTVIYNANGGTGLMQNTVVTDYNSGESAVTLAACSYTKQYNTFIGWSVGGNTYNVGDTVMVVGNSSVTATAVWEKIIYTSGDWRYTVENGYATLIQYDGVPNGVFVIPGTVDRYPVSMVGNGTPILTEGTSAWELDLTNAKAINDNAFSGYSHLYGTIVLPSSLTYIGHNAFSDIQGIADMISYLNDSAVIESDAFEDSSVSEVLNLGTMAISSNSFGLDATVKTNLEMIMCIGDYADSYTKVIGKGNVYDVLPIISLVLVAGILVAATGYLLYRRE